MTRTHYDLDDLGGSLSWRSLYSFIKNVGGNSALARDLDRATGWDETLKTNAILADMYDLLQVIRAEIVALGGKKPRKIKPYPRPGADEDKKRRFGKGAMPLSDLRNWIKERQKHG